MFLQIASDISKSVALLRNQVSRSVRTFIIEYYVVLLSKSSYITIMHLEHNVLSQTENKTHSQERRKEEYF